MIRITAKDNPTIKHIIRLISSAKYRRQSGEFVIEGSRLCSDAFDSGCRFSALVASDSAMAKHGVLINKLNSKALKGYVVKDDIYNKMSDTKSPQGILCVIKTLDNPTQFDKIKCNGKFLALENIQDPSNLGTILRTAEALGIDGVILSEDCCDIYSPKVLRGSMGAVFRLPYLITEDIVEFIKNNPMKSYAAVVDKDARGVEEADFDSPCLVAIGNEGNGLRKATVNACDLPVTIHMNGRAESLNASVAASIIAWEMVK